MRCALAWSATCLVCAGAKTALTVWLTHSDIPADVEVTIAIGSPLHEILEHVRTLKADLLVAGIAGTGQTVSGAGAVSGKLARKSPSRVLLVRSNHPHAFRKVVACLDFSDSAREVMASAHRIAIKDSASVDFLHIWQEPLIASPYGATGDTLIGIGHPTVVFTPAERNTLQEGLRRELHGFVSAAALGIQSSEVLQESLNYTNGIVAHAEAVKADLIIVGSKGRTNLRYVLMGSTAERLLTRLPCSVLVVRPPAQA